MMETKESKKIAFKDLLTKKQYIIIAAVFVALLAALVYIFFTPNNYKREEPVVFIVQKGASVNHVIDDLYKNGVIPNKTNMKIASYIYGSHRAFKAGRYEIPNGLSYLGLVELFTKGAPAKETLVTLQEGITIKEMAGILKHDLGIDSAVFVKLAMNKEMAGKKGIDAVNLEGYLLPDSYYFYADATPQEVLNKLTGEFKSFLADSLKKRAEEMGYTVNELITLASVVQGESRFADEMPRVAGVYLNRLKIGMPLQADPTIQYILGGRWRRILNKDLEINSPYNTYKFAGLPPTPINNPGRDAILAAFYPEQHSYYYFVAQPNGTGRHTFSKNLSEHNRAVQEYNKWIKPERRRLKNEKR